MMKHRNVVFVLSVCISALALVAGLTGILSSGGPGPHEFASIRGETVTLYGNGIYQNDSASSAAQAIAQDWVTVCLGIPLLLISGFLARRGGLRARLLLTGTLAYFLYTYITYSFLCMYNALFLVYVALMSLSFFAFVLSMMSFDLTVLADAFSKRFPAKSIGGVILALAALIGLMWLGRIAPSLPSGAAPVGLEHYSTLVIQAMDLGFVVPVSILSAVLLIRRRPFGMLLSAVMCMKGLTLLTSLTAMLVGQVRSGIAVSPAELVIFPAANLLVLIGVLVFMMRIREPGKETNLKAEWEAAK